MGFPIYTLEDWHDVLWTLHYSWFLHCLRTWIMMVLSFKPSHIHIYHFKLPNSICGSNNIKSGVFFDPHSCFSSNWFGSESKLIWTAHNSSFIFCWRLCCCWWYIYAKILRSGVADYVIFLITLHDITFQWWSNTHNSNQNPLLSMIFLIKIVESTITEQPFFIAEISS